MGTPPERLEYGDLGGDKEDEGTPTNDKKYYTARQINLTHQIAIGMNLVTPKTMVLTEWNAGETRMDILLSGETWDPKGEHLPDVTRTDPGKYVVQYAASYPNYDGQDVAPALVAAEAEVQTLFRLEADAEVRPDGRTIDVYVRDRDTGVFTDAKVLVRAY
jgi:L-lactate utilization protein LutB